MRRGPSIRGLALGSWLLAMTGGFAYLFSYSFAAGASAEPPGLWPSGSVLERPVDRPRLLLFVHPRCPCSRATLDELARLTATTGNRLETQVVFLQPAEVDPSWSRTDLRRAAAAIPGVDVVTDHEGDEARRFGAATSGQALLYDTSGHLVFAGGITGARGHSGDNAGRDAVVRIATGSVATAPVTPVFGCALFDDDGRCHAGTDLCGR